MNINYIARYIQNKYSFFNTGSGEKKVLTKWTKYQNEYPIPQDVIEWTKYPTQNYAIVTGEISNLVVFDIDTKNGADPTPFQNLGMYEVRTPSGGYHFYCQYDPLLKSTKHKKTPQAGLLKGVDIQSNGALVFAPPSVFQNGAYTVVNDVPVDKIPDELLIKVLEALEPEKEDTDPKPYIPQQHHLNANAKPGEIFNALASWEDVLIPDGWTKVGRQSENGRQFWRRPGKKDGISASTNYNGYDLLFAYTSSTSLIPYKGYTKFNALTQLKYDGNHSECAKALVMQRTNSSLSSKIILNK